MPTTTTASSHTPTFLKQSVHHHKATSKRGILERLFTVWFKGFVYNQIWEDPRVDAQALQLDENSRMLTISSGGCNVMNYLLHDPQKIVAIDLNTAHMSLTRLKLCAIEHLPNYEAFYNFFGFGKHATNLENYHLYLRPHLDRTSRKFWESSHWPTRKIGPKRIKYFRRGLYDQAKLGQFLRVVHTFGKLTRRDPKKLFAAKTLKEQQEIFEKVYGPIFENRFVRWLSKLPVSVFSLGIPPSQFQVMREESKGKLLELYKERVRKLACGFPLDDNYFAWQAFGRGYDHENRSALPEYLKEKNFPHLKRNVNRVETHIMTLTGILNQMQPGELNRFVLLDSQDWMPPHVIADLWSEIDRVGAPDTRIIFRTAGEVSPIETALPPDLRKKFTYEVELSKKLHEQDRSAIYGGFHVYAKNR